MASQVFISHNHADKAAYSSLCLALDSLGVSRWDVLDLALGKPLAEGLRDAIQECHVCIFLATARSIESKWCLAELGAFWGAGKKVIIYHADPEIEESQLPPQFLGNLWTSDAKQLVNAIKRSDSGRVQKTKNGYCTWLNSMTINVCLGGIETFDYSGDDCLVALPANEFFDDDCIHDIRSSLGAFMNHYFKDDISKIQSLVSDALKNEPSKNVNKKPKETAPSYGLGKCVFLNSPLSSNLRVAMVSVTTQRADQGLRAGAAYLFEAAESLQCVMANNRLTRLYLPILGSGYGGLRGEVSLICMLIAFGELHRKYGHKLKEVNIVVFKRSENHPPSISEANIEYALDFVTRFLSM